MSKGGFPGWRYDPVARVGQLFASADEVPDGWLDHVPEEGAQEGHRSPVAAKSGTGQGMTRKETVAALQSGGVAFKPTMKTDELQDLLRSKVVEVLTVRGIEFDESADTRALLAQLG